MLYVVLIYLASLFASHINASCVFLVWVGCTILTFLIVFCNEVLNQTCILSEHLFFFHNMLDVVGHWDLKMVNHIWVVVLELGFLM